MSKGKPEGAHPEEDENKPAQAENEHNENVEPQADDAPSEEQQQLDDAKAEAEQAKDQALRAMAELENVRRRAQKDVEAARKYALEKFATELLGARDSLEMGLQAAQQENGNFASLKEGTEITLKMLVGAMEKFSIEQINPEGESFNPELHEAMSMQESAEHPNNTVLHVMQKGYQLNGRVLRPAMVIVSKAPPADSAK